MKDVLIAILFIASGLATLGMVIQHITGNPMSALVLGQMVIICLLVISDIERYD